MNRSDTKFTFSVQKLPILLEKLVPFYDVLEINGKRLHSYKSLYFDTDDRKFYNDHHNRRVNRHKIRFREYEDSGLIFLEVKCKNNKGKTIKKRMKVNKIPNTLSNDHQRYVTNIMGYSLPVSSKQWINFNRVTLVHKKQKERLTIDVNLNYSDGIANGDLSKVIIAEVKQERMSRSSDFIRIAKDLKIYPMRLSKYCFTTMQIDHSLKKNRFKEKQIFINKIINE
tara:strand:- start:1585 stop:2262 length:678 start_codon:yes stop_codon:yes gene_type:complete